MFGGKDYIGGLVANRFEIDGSEIEKGRCVSMVIRKATVEDVEQLVEVRRQFQETVKGTRGSEFFAQAVEGYLRKHVPLGTCVVWLAEDNGEIVSCAMLALVEELPVLGNLSGRVGFLHNVYTNPRYRRQGLAQQIVVNCLQSAKEWGVGRVCLGATEQGRSLYEKLGFKALNDEMQLDF